MSRTRKTTERLKTTTVKTVRTIGNGVKTSACKVSNYKSTESNDITKSTLNAPKKAATILSNIISSMAVIFNWKTWIVIILCFILFFVYCSTSGIISTEHILNKEVALKFAEEILLLRQGMVSQIKSDVANADVIRITNPTSDESKLKIDLKEILAYMMVEYDMDLDGSEDEVAILRALFSQMYTYEVTYKKANVKLNGNDDGKLDMEVEITAYITINIKSMDELIENKKWSKSNKEFYQYLVDTMDLEKLYPGIDLREFEAIDIIANDLNEIIKSAQEIDLTREEVVNIARSLVGRVNYFWGGKSPAAYNPLWGSLQLVTAPGHRTTGTYQPYGLDCSGFVEWVFKTAGARDTLIGGTGAQWNNSIGISQNQLLPGDLGFMAPPTSSGAFNHIGIFSGMKNGRKTFVHCTGGLGVVENQTTSFHYWRRALVHFKGE
jgi:hypothetical protein